MRSMEDKEISGGGGGGGGGVGFEFHKGNGTNKANSISHHHHNLHGRSTGLGKPTPSKWDDAQKWLMGLSRGVERSHVSNNQARNSNADDRRLIAPVPQKEQDSSSSEDEGEEEGHGPETKKVMDCDGSVWRVSKPRDKSSALGVRSVCVRDMGTEMTPIASQEPSRTGTPIRARTPISSGSSTPVRPHQAAEAANCGNEETKQCREESHGVCNMPENNHSSVDQARNPSTLETRAMAWDEAERAKYMARYKREEVKIQAWENHEKRKAEMEMKKLEVKAERMKARAQERLANKLAATRRIAEEKRANAEAKLNEKAARTSERADYIRRTGHLPSSFSFKLPRPSLCW